MALSPCGEDIFSSRPKHLPEAGGCHIHPRGHSNMTLRQRFATSVLAGALICTGIVSATADSAAAAPLPKVSVAARFEGVATTAAAALAAVGTNGFAIRLDEVASIVAGRLGVDAARLR